MGTARHGATVVVSRRSRERRERRSTRWQKLGHALIVLDGATRGDASVDVSYKDWRKL